MEAARRPYAWVGWSTSRIDIEPGEGPAWRMSHVNSIPKVAGTSLPDIANLLFVALCVERGVFVDAPVPQTAILAVIRSAWAARGSGDLAT